MLPNHQSQSGVPDMPRINNSINMRTILCSFALSLMFLTSAAQQTAPTDVPTPNASDLGRFGDIPVSLYTGSPNISIPIHTLKTSEMEFPITLNYDASGVLVNSLPGWMGHNWSLSAGGMITRKKNAQCDEYIPITQSSIFPFSNYFNSYWRLKEDMHDDNVLTSNVEFHRCDYQPDVFTFNFMGKTGKFFLGNDGQWKVFSEDNLDIVFDINDPDNYIYPFIERMPGDITSTKAPKVIKGFTIRDDRGFIYEFGGNGDAIEYTTPFFRQSESENVESFYATSWFLTSIKDKYGNMLYELEYQRGKFIAQFYNSAYSIHVYEKNVSSGLHIGQDFYYNNFHLAYDGVLNSPVYLSKIKSVTFATVEFHTSYSAIPTEQMYPTLNVFRPFIDSGYSGKLFYYLQADRRDITPYQYENTQKEINPLGSTRLNELTEININNGAKTVKMNYDYNSRMHLTEVDILYGNKETPPACYRLDYRLYSQLPKDYLSTASDHWGYYNGRPFKFSEGGYAQKRSPSNPESTFGQLTSITYPTGGKSVFFYENHDYSTCVSDDRKSMKSLNGITGGMRIKSITDYSNESGGMLRKRTYIYNDPKTGKSSGELFAEPKYAWMNWMATLDTKDAVAMQSFSRAASIIPLSNSFGPHIGYSVVEEKEEDGSFSRYYYKNISEAMDERFIKDFSSGEPSPFDMFTERGYKRGKLKAVEQYGADNRLFRKTKYGYVKENVETDSVLSSNLAYTNYGASAVFSYFTGGIYKLLFPKYDIVADTTVTYYDNGSIEDTRTYNKSNRLLPVSYVYPHKTLVRTLSSESATRKGNTVTKEYTYPFSSDGTVNNRLYSLMFTLEPLSEKTYLNGNLTGGYVKRYRFNDTGRPVIDSYMRINSDDTQDTIIKYHSYTKMHEPETYTELGKPMTKLKWSGTYIYEYEAGCDANSQNDMKSFVTVQYHDTNGNIDEVVLPNGKTFNYYYDADGRLTEANEDYNVILKKIIYNYKQK